MTYRKKLIEVALPLEAINVESAREKSIRHGHPSTLHLWWSRKPLATTRAVLWASLVDDPSSWPEKFPTEEAQNQERQRLFDILGRIEIEKDKKGNIKQVVRGLVSWDEINQPNSAVLLEAQREIARCLAWERGEEPPTKPDAIRDYIAKYAPPAYDPFCGGGSIPLEAQRLGLQAHGSDLNPVAVLITKALIEIPPKFQDKPPVNPDSRQKQQISSWDGAQGLAADVRYYGQWMRDEAFKRIGYLYPMVETNHKGTKDTKVIAWLWARTVKCPNPACGCQMPLVNKFSLSTKKGKEAWVEPVINHKGTKDTKGDFNHRDTEDTKGDDFGVSGVPKISFEVKTGKGTAPDGTVNRKGAVCIACNTPVPFDHIRNEGKAGRMDAQLMAIVAEGQGGRIYLSPDEEQVRIANSAQPEWKPDADLPHNPRDFKTPNYGMRTFADLFTPRQLVALTTFSDLVGEAREKIKADAVAAGIPDDDLPLNDGGIGATAYADAVATYLGLAVSRSANTICSLAVWSQSRDQSVNVFSRQALPMNWDFPEVNPFAGAAGDFGGTTQSLSKSLATLPSNIQASVQQQEASSGFGLGQNIVIATDPPYYDNIGYADLSDFFYVWLRRSLNAVYPEIFSTLLVPKAQELVATPYRFGGNKAKAQEFFEAGLGKVFARIHEISHSDYPLTVYYAFKQAETQDGEDNDSNIVVASTGWETMLEGLIKSDFSIGGTWPMRTERPTGVKISVNALASSIVLVCRPRPTDAPKAGRRQFLNELKRDLPQALKLMQQGNIAPVDLAQASIGPGMAIYSKYAAILESNGSPLRVRTALQLINQILDQFLTEQEGEFDSDTRWALTWFEQYQFNEGLYGDAETLSKAKNTSIQGMVEAGILEAKAGKVRLLKREELKTDGHPEKDERIPVWQITQNLIHTLDKKGETGAAELLAKLGNKADLAKELAYRLYSLCDRKGWTQEGIAYNTLVTSWPEITRLANEYKPSPEQLSFSL